MGCAMLFSVHFQHVNCSATQKIVVWCYPIYIKYEPIEIAFSMLFSHTLSLSLPKIANTMPVLHNWCLPTENTVNFGMHTQQTEEIFKVNYNLPCLPNKNIHDKI